MTDQYFDGSSGRYGQGSTSLWNDEVFGSQNYDSSNGSNNNISNSANGGSRYLGAYPNSHSASSSQMDVNLLRMMGEISSLNKLDMNDIGRREQQLPPQPLPPPAQRLVMNHFDPPNVTDCNLYVKNIDYDISEEMLYAIFSQMGEITSHHIVRDVNGRSRGFGFM
jgi:RNA recognition motif-containing protein